jgi:hypothetical protein
VAAVAALVALSSGCGDMVRDGQSPTQLVINSLQAAAGGDTEFAGFLQSDVITRLDEEDPDSCTILNDAGQVTMSLFLKDAGNPTLTTSPSVLNQVTITSYRVDFRRTDGPSTPGVSVPQPLVSSVTFTVPNGGQVTASFNLVRQTAKLEPPLLALRNSLVLFSMIADVTFAGHDQVGNTVTAQGTIGVTFGDFGPGC